MIKILLIFLAATFVNTMDCTSTDGAVYVSNAKILSKFKSQVARSYKDRKYLGNLVLFKASVIEALKIKLLPYIRRDAELYEDVRARMNTINEKSTDRKKVIECISNLNSKLEKNWSHGSSTKPVFVRLNKMMRLLLLMRKRSLESAGQEKPVSEQESHALEQEAQFENAKLFLTHKLRKLEKIIVASVSHPMIFAGINCVESCSDVDELIKMLRIIFKGIDRQYSTEILVEELTDAGELSSADQAPPGSDTISPAVNAPNLSIACIVYIQMNYCLADLQKCVRACFMDVATIQDLYLHCRQKINEPLLLNLLNIIGKYRINLDVEVNRLIDTVISMRSKSNDRWIWYDIISICEKLLEAIREYEKIVTPENAVSIPEDSAYEIQAYLEANKAMIGLNGADNLPVPPNMILQEASSSDAIPAANAVYCDGDNEMDAEEEIIIDEEEADIDEEEAVIDEEEVDIDEEEAGIDEEEADIEEEIIIDDEEDVGAEKGVVDDESTKAIAEIRSMLQRSKLIFEISLLARAKISDEYTGSLSNSVDNGPDTASEDAKHRNIFSLITKINMNTLQIATFKNALKKEIIKLADSDLLKAKDAKELRSLLFLLGGINSQEEMVNTLIPALKNMCSQSYLSW